MLDHASDDQIRAILEEIDRGDEDCLPQGTMRSLAEEALRLRVQLAELRLYAIELAGRLTQAGS